MLSATEPPPSHPANGSEVRPDGVRAVVSFTVVPDMAMNLIALRACFAFGWGLVYSGGYEGSRLEIPGVGSYKLRHEHGHAHAYLDLVQTANGVTVKTPTNPLHDGLRCTPSWRTRGPSHRWCGHRTGASLHAPMSLMA